MSILSLLCNQLLELKLCLIIAYAYKTLNVSLYYSWNGRLFSCKKIDQEDELTKTAKGLNVTENFFTVPAATNPIIKLVAKGIERQNEKLGFVKKLVNNIGYPHWNKAIVLQKPIGDMGRGNYTTETESPVNVVLIPFARPSENLVNAALKITLYPEDTVFQFLLDWQYRDTAATGMEAKDLSLLLMVLHNNVFGDTLFKINDSLLFNSAAGKAAYVSVQPGSVMTNDNTTLGRTVTTTTVTVCHNVQVPKNQGQMVGCDPGEGCFPYTWEYRCESVTWIEETGDDDDYGGGGWSDPGGTGGGGGNSGGSGGWVPPPNPCTTPATTTPQTGFCDGGWSPIPNPHPMPPEPIDSMLARYSRAINKTSDSIFQLSMNSAIKEEWGFPFVQKGTDVYPKRCTTIHRTEQVILDRYKDAGEIIMGELHTHPDASPNPLMRSASSGDDLETLNVNSRLNYTIFIECGNVRYSLVIENVALARAYLANHPTDVLAADQSDLAQTQPNWDTNWQNATQAALVQLLGASTACGIGFYKSDTSKTNFTKIN